MNINGNTKVMARLHNSSDFGLDLYNNYFNEAKSNSIYIRFTNENVIDLLDGIRKLNISGAITAGFETSAEFAELIDVLDESSVETNRVGVVVNEGGVLKGYYQCGTGLFNAINTKSKIRGKRIVILGAGSVARGLLHEISNHCNGETEVSVYNRTEEKSKELMERYPFIVEAGGLPELSNASGDIFVNATRIGSVEDTDNLFSENLINKFSVISDVTFKGYTTDLIKIASKNKKILVKGNDMFMHQGKVCLERILNETVDEKLFQQIVDDTLKQLEK